MKNYILTIRIPFTALDDMDARNKSKNSVYLELNGDSFSEKVVKLQEVFENKAPRGLEL